jgi:hypothetical protein
MFDRSTAPVWLFSFVDLAFLLLVAITQVVEVGDQGELSLGEIVVPRIRTESATPLAHDDTERWLVRVHPLEAQATGVFGVALRHSDRAATPGKLDLPLLTQRLDALSDQGVGKPLLAPHSDARAADLLAAVALIESRWPSARLATIAPVSAGPR